MTTTDGNQRGSKSGLRLVDQPIRLQRGSLREQALDVIRRAMVSGEIEPGHIYSATSLAGQLGVSTGPVREAMQTLVHGGIMEVVPNRGFRVIPLSAHDLDEVYELRLLLEAPAMHRLAELDLQPWVGELTQHIEACVEAAGRTDPRAFLESDRRFHLTLLGLLGNSRLVAAVDNLRDQTRIYGMRALAAQDALQRSAQEHAQLLDALRRGDGGAAQDLLVQHMSHRTWPDAAPAAAESADSGH
jgi:DNA-binding GntR family transcriptional regulator